MLERTHGELERAGSTGAAQHRLAWLGACLLALAQPVQAVRLDESVLRVPVAAGGEQAYIDVTVFKPRGAGPFPVLVLSHGSPRDAADRRVEGRQRLAAQSERFVNMGFAVLVPTRRGYGQSSARWAETYGSCASPDYYRAGLETARDLHAAVDAVRAEPWADTGRVVLAGQSAGGFGSVAAASGDFQGLVAVVNFAGGRGSRARDDVCAEDLLVEAMARYGENARVPQLWIYSGNDRFFGPTLAQRMHAAFVRSGGSAEFIRARSIGLDGHAYFATAPDDWVPRVAQFLLRVGAMP